MSEFNNHDQSRQQNQYYQQQNQHYQQQNHAFHQQAAYAQQNPNMQSQYQTYPGQMNYGNQYAQQGQQYYDEYQGGEEEYEQDDFANLAEIDRELNNSSNANNIGELTEEEAVQAEFEREIEQKKSKSFLPAGAMPTGANGVLSPHAAEFWFPECRNCECCKGFKHGCGCCKNGVTTCTSPACVDGVFTQQVSNELASRPAAPAQSAAPSTGGNYNVEAPSSPTPYPRAAAPASAASDICKFESGPGGCRFGSSCRFKHSSPATSGPPAGAGTKPQCMFFARGNCQYGDSCRFGHY